MKTTETIHEMHSFSQLLYHSWVTTKEWSGREREKWETIRAFQRDFTPCWKYRD